MFKFDSSSNIENPNKQTITYEDIKRLANEVGEDMEDDQAKRANKHKRNK